ncbi:MAG: hypothetical protein HY654_00300 [Acidobacteria bacterium]|nr:hypothetical protein [Acidobacteriota bacterium]
MVTARTLILGLSLLTASPLSAEERLTLHAPGAAFEPAILRMRASVQPDPGNRAIEITADSDAFYRSSWIPLDGDRAPRTIAVEFRNLPAGHYQLSAVLIRADGERTKVQRDFIVTER